MAVLTSVTLTTLYALVRLAARWLWGEPFSLAVMISGYLRGSLILDLAVYMGVSGAVHAAVYHEGLLAERVAASHLEAELAQSRLRLLRVQLNPHFLFNLLNTAASLVYEEPRTVDLLIGRLSAFLRAVLGASETDRTELEEELAVTRLYGELQVLRFGEGVDIAFEVEKGVGHAAVPSLLLQPLLENAIVHGRDPGRPLHVWVRARREGADVVLEVEDDGRGMALNGAFIEGLGLGSTRGRLRLLYGTQQRLAIEPGSAGGFRVRARFPYSPWSEESG
jgi:LytS/YehU family sensor histidine kinase